jgi:hypothetical protein
MQVLTRRRRRERELRSAPTKPTGGLEPPTGGHHHEAAIKASADAELTPPAQIGLPLTGGDGEYPGPFGSRTRGQSKPRLNARPHLRHTSSNHSERAADIGTGIGRSGLSSGVITEVPFCNTPNRCRDGVRLYSAAASAACEASECTDHKVSS